MVAMAHAAAALDVPKPLSSDGDAPASARYPRVSLAAAVCLAVAGVAGVCAHASQLYSPVPPPGGGGSALNVLLAALTAVFALEAAWWTAPGTAPLSRGAAAAACRGGVACILLAVVPALCVLYAVGYRLDAAGWCVARAQVPPHARAQLCASPLPRQRSR